MKQFSHDYLDIRLLPDDLAMTLQEFYYENEKYRITVLPGFVFDGASVPIFFWRVIGHPFSYKLVRAAVIHDILYASEYLTRVAADNLFEEMLDVADVSEWKEDAMYLAVRAGGGSVWDEHTESSVLNSLEYIKVEVKNEEIS